VCEAAAAAVHPGFHAPLVATVAVVEAWSDCVNSAFVRFYAHVRDSIVGVNVGPFGSIACLAP
jgi:hypothetical protein